MRIARYGDNKPDNELTCLDCQSTLEIDAEDIQYAAAKSGKIATTEGWYVRCPVCRHVLWISRDTRLALTKDDVSSV